MNVFISYSHRDNIFALDLASVLESDGYEVFVDNKIPIGNNLYRDIGKGIAKADAVIIIVSQSSNDSEFVANEAASFISFFDRGRMPLIIPVVIGKDTLIPQELKRFNCIVIPSTNNTQYYDNVDIHYSIFGPSIGSSINNAIDKIRLILAAHDEKLRKAQQEKEQSEAKVKTGLTRYIDNVFKTLQENERRNKRFAYGLYLLSAVALIGILITIVLRSTSIDILNVPIERLIVYGVAYLFITIILISFSKLFFTLAKAFMVESIRCSDRIHAISFGKFFIEAYGENATIEQILQAFSAWNYDNGGSSFRTQSGDDYDPKFSQLISKLKG
jgi:hypothetical protein